VLVPTPDITNGLLADMKDKTIAIIWPGWRDVVVRALGGRDWPPTARVRTLMVKVAKVYVRLRV